MTLPHLAPYDPLDPAHHADPAARLAEARDRCPVSQPRPGVHFLARHDDVRDVLTAPETYSSVDNFALEGAATTADLPAATITQLDPPDHTALRARLRRWFAPAVIRKQEPRVREIVSDVLDAWQPGEKAELHHDLARQVPTRVVYAFLGLPEEDWERLHQWADAIDDILPKMPIDMPEFVALTRYLGEQFAARAAAPATGDGVLDVLAHPADGEPQLTPAEAVIHAFQLIVAATDTTASLITNLLHELLADHSHWERLLADRSLIPTAIEESLRHDAPLQYVLRTVKQEREISGCPVKPGDRLAVSLQSANWDERAWGPDAADFSLDRPAGQATTMAFGYGIHTCLGAPLARLQARVVLEHLLERFPGLRLVPGYHREAPEGLLLTRRPARLDVVL
ncbi:cytochrome P450 [Streptomyces sp. SAI-144]|jgi:cytochrome P450|uniref:cytochrome P450 n=1 Tax=Streptomyces sp. SAI-144 TaxID=2940544 RepID=UPI002475233C|nr:cytochrome P450 [Streptomyces sp. SAI-144]MDH6437098.1 cytochrome P450 [Streptomyces sp. SAI-144]